MQCICMQPGKPKLHQCIGQPNYNEQFGVIIGGGVVVVFVVCGSGRGEIVVIHQ